MTTHAYLHHPSLMHSNLLILKFPLGKFEFPWLISSFSRHALCIFGTQIFFLPLESVQWLPVTRSNCSLCSFRRNSPFFPIGIAQCAVSSSIKPNWNTHCVVCIHSKAYWTPLNALPVISACHWQLGWCNVQIQLIISLLYETQLHNISQKLPSLLDDRSLKWFMFLRSHFLVVSVFLYLELHQLFRGFLVVQASWFPGWLDETIL